MGTNTAESEHCPAKQIEKIASNELKDARQHPNFQVLNEILLAQWLYMSAVSLGGV